MDPDNGSTATLPQNDNVKVCVRVRPFNQQERNEPKILVANPSSKTILFGAQPDSTLFGFDYVGDENTTQEEMWANVGKPIVEACIAGYNGTIFAYGQTGSGKTFTVQGGLDKNGDAIPELRGLIPRALEALFRSIQREELSTAGRVKFQVKCSFLEIFQEQICDLLNPGTQSLHVRDDAKRGVYVENLVEEIVTTADQAQHFLNVGAKNRHVGQTLMNERSSRSHSVFMLSIEATDNRGNGTARRFSRMTLVDLAGSERQKRTEASGSRLKEASSINKSLFLLGEVIRALVDIAGGKTRHVAYRDSKLTYLLKDSIGGNSKTTIVATVSAAENSFQESLSTLKFARRAKFIQNQAVVNQENTTNVIELQMELKRLKQQLAMAQSLARDELANPAAQSSRQLISAEERSRLLATRGPNEDLAEKHPEVRIRELESLLCTALERAQDAETEQQKLLSRMEELKQLNENIDRSLQTAKMMQKFRETEVATLKKDSAKTAAAPTPAGAKGTAPQVAASEAKVASLQQELKLVKQQYEHHPKVAELALENFDLKSKVSVYEKQYASQLAANQSELSRLKTLVNGLGTQIQDIVAEKHLLEEKFKAMQQQKLDEGSLKSPARSRVLRRLFAEGEQSGSADATLREELAQLKKHIADDCAANQKAQTALAEQLAKSQQLAERLQSELQATKEGDLVAKLRQQEDEIRELRAALATKNESNAVVSSASGSTAPPPSTPVAISQPSRRRSLEEDEEISFKPVPKHSIEVRLQLKEQQNEALMQEIAEVREEFETLQQEFKYRSEQYKQKVDALAVEQKRVAEAEAKLNTAYERCESQEETIRKQQTLIDSFKKEEANQSSSENKRLVIESVEENTRLRSAMDRLQQDLDKATAATQEEQLRAHSLQKTLDELKSEMQLARATAADREAYYRQLEAQIAETQEKHDSAVAALVDAQGASETAVREKNALASELERLKEEADDQQQAADMDIRRLQGAVREHEAEVARLRAEHQKLEDLAREDSRQLTEQIRVLQEKLESDNVAHAAALKELTLAHQAKESSWLKDIAVLEQKLESVSLQLSRVSEEKLELLRECSLSQNKFTEEIKKLENETIRTLNDRVAESAARLATNSEQLESTREELRRVRESHSQLEDTLAAKNTSVAQLETRVSELRTALQDSESKLTVLEAANKHLQSQVSALEEKMHKAQQQFTAELQEQRDILEADIVRLTGENVSLREEQQRLIVDRQVDLDYMKRLKDAESRAFEESMQYKERVEQLSEERLKTLKERDELQKLITDLQAQNAKLVGHQNQKQKIQLHVRIKEENNTLKKEKGIIVEKLRQKEQLAYRLALELKKHRKLDPAHDGVEEKELPFDMEEEEKLRAKLKVREQENQTLNTQLENITKELLTLDVLGGARTSAAGSENLPPATSQVAAKDSTAVALKRITDQLRSKDRRISELEFSLQMLQKEAALSQRHNQAATALRDATNRIASK